MTDILLDITNIKDRDALLEALWTHSSKTTNFFTGQPIIDYPFNIETARKSLGFNGYADYICGRVIKANIYDSNTVNPVDYDRNNGKDAFQTVLNSLR